MENALVSEADEGRVSLRYAAGSWQKALIRRSPNGETHKGLCPCILRWINSLCEGKPVNWNILVTGRKENNLMIAKVAASEIAIA